MADDYTIENVGADDYAISNVGGRRRHRGARGRNEYGGWGYAPDPLFYQIVQDDDGHYKKVADDDTDDAKGSTVAGMSWSAVGGPSELIYPAGWGGPDVNLGAQFHIVHKRVPTTVERSRLAFYPKMAHLAISEAQKGNGPQNRERDYWNYLGFAKYYIDNLKLVDDQSKPLGQSHWAPGMQAQWQTIANRGNDIVNKKVAASSRGFFGSIAHAVSNVGSDIVHTANNAAKLAGKAVNSVGKAASSIPVVGPLVHATLALNPYVLAGGLVANTLQGERIDHAFIDVGKKQLAGIKEIAPYASTIVSFVPGVGTGVAAAIAAGQALAEGKTITQALLSATRSAIPGGPLALAAFDATQTIAQGKNVADSAVKAAISQLPPAAQSAAKVAMSAAKGQNVKTAVLQAIRQNLPAAGQKALDIGVAVGTARNVQSALVGAIAKGVGTPALMQQGAAVLASNPKFAKAAQALSPAAKQGFAKTIGLLSNKAVNPHAIVAMRTAAKLDERTGIDHALKTYVNHFTPEWPTLVSGGNALRGNWKPAKPTDKNAVRGRLVKNGKVTLGHFSRV